MRVHLPRTGACARAVRALLASALLSGVASGCASAARFESPGGEMARAKAAPASAEGSTAGTPVSQAAERMLARRAWINVELEELGGVRQRVEAMARALDGYVENSTGDDKRSLRMTLRVPAPSLGAALDTLRGLGRVRSERRQEEDVTEAVIDADARLANLKSVRDRLRQHLAQATNVTEVVAVERELARVQGDVDALEARLKHLRGTVAMAELTLTAERKVVLGPLGLVAQGAGWVIGKLFVWRY